MGPKGESGGYGAESRTFPHMHYPAVRRRAYHTRYPRVALPVTYTAAPGGLGLSLDLGELLARLELREVLKEAGVTGRV